MEKRFEPLTVKTTQDGQIMLTQDYQTGEESATIYLQPEQVETVIKWLEEARAELSQR